MWEELEGRRAGEGEISSGPRKAISISLFVSRTRKCGRSLFFLPPSSLRLFSHSLHSLPATPSAYSSSNELKPLSRQRIGLDHPNNPATPHAHQLSRPSLYSSSQSTPPHFSSRRRNSIPNLRAEISFLPYELNDSRTVRLDTFVLATGDDEEEGDHKVEEWSN